MKKRTSSKSNTESTQGLPAIMGLIGTMQQQLAIIEKKMDTLINKSLATPPAERRFPRLFTHSAPHAQSHQRRDERQDNNFRERILHKAVCADCKKQCEVPFKPTGDRPVYCKDCFSKRRIDTSFNPNVASTHSMPSIAPVRHQERVRVSETVKPERKRSATFSKKKKRS